jgi:hypothetical protein
MNLWDKCHNIPPITDSLAIRISQDFTAKLEFSHKDAMDTDRTGANAQSFSYKISLAISAALR